MTPEELRTACNRNLVAAFSTVSPYAGLGGETRAFGGVTAIYSGVAAAFYNPIMVLDPIATPDDLRNAIAWVRERGREPSVQVREDRRSPFDGPLNDLGFVADAWLTPGMALQPVPVVVPASPGELTIDVFGGRGPGRDENARLERWHTAFGSGPIFRQLMPPVALSNSDFVFALGSDRDGPVASALAFRFEDSLGVYAVGTAERARRRGFGTAVTWAVIDAGRRRWGSEVAILQSSELGLGVYRRMGFAEVARYVAFELPTPPPEGARAAPDQG